MKRITLFSTLIILFGLATSNRQINNGDIYEGALVDGQPHGLGTLTYAGGNKYVGAFNNGLMHGHGTLSFASGSSYVGEWKNGKWDGKGIFKYVDGSIWHSGLWKDGGPVVVEKNSGAALDRATPSNGANIPKNPNVSTFQPPPRLSWSR